MIGERNGSVYPNCKTTPGTTNPESPFDAVNCPKLCLNGDDPLDPVARTGECITSWEGVRSMLGGPYVILSQAIDVESSSRLDEKQFYDQQSGSSSVKQLPQTSPQSAAYGTYLTAPRLCRAVTKPSTGELVYGCTIESNTLKQKFTCNSWDDPCEAAGPGYHCNKKDQQCEKNCDNSADCSTSHGGEAIQVYDGGVTNNAAAKFLGRVLIGVDRIQESASVKISRRPDELELKGLPNFGWQYISGTVNSYLRLQQPGSVLPDTGSIKLTGVMAVDLSAVAGVLKNRPDNATCGDGMCAAWETLASCPIDCQTLPPLENFVIANAGSQKLQLNFTTGTIAAPGWNVVIIRVPNNNFTADIVPGRSYRVGDPVGNATVVYSQLVSGNQPVTFTDTGLINGTRYYYRAYQGNGLYRYSPSVAGDAVPNALYSVIVTNTDGNLGAITSSSIGLSCGSQCTATVASGTPVSLKAIPAGGASFTSWNGTNCDGSTSTVCSMTVSSPVIVSGGFSD